MKTTALLLHGLCSTPDELLPVHSALRRAGCGVRPVHVPGYSFDRAAAQQQARPAAHWVRAVAAAIDSVPEDRPVVLVGLSAGAVLALAAAMERPQRVAGLVLMSTPLRLDGWGVPRHHFLLPLALYSPLGRLWKYRERPPYGVKNPRVRSWIEHEIATRQVSRAGRGPRTDNPVTPAAGNAGTKSGSMRFHGATSAGTWRANSSAVVR